LRAIHIEDSRWPLVVLTFEGHPSDEDFSRYLGEMFGLLSRQERHAYVIDARRGALLSRALRRQQGEWLKEHKAAIQRFSLGTGVVIGSGVLRFVLATIHLIQPPIAPTVILPTIEEATAWAETRLREAGLALPPITRSR
jgi:hypothetical protein